MPETIAFKSGWFFGNDDHAPECEPSDPGAITDELAHEANFAPNAAQPSASAASPARLSRGRKPEPTYPGLLSSLIVSITTFPTTPNDSALSLSIVSVSACQ